WLERKTTIKHLFHTALILAPLLALPLRSHADIKGGDVDLTFVPGPLSGGIPPIYVSSMAVQSDGKLLIGGNFSREIARLNRDGSVDTNFLNGLAGANDVVNAVAARPDGKILIGGYFDSVNGTPRNKIALLNTNGSLDAVFQNGMNGVAGGTVYFPSNV